MRTPAVIMRWRLSFAFAYSAAEHASVPGGKSISGLETCRKLHGLPAARSRASSVLSTSYGGAMTSALRPGAGLRAASGRTSGNAEAFGDGVGGLEILPSRPAQLEWRDASAIRQRGPQPNDVRRRRRAAAGTDGP